jgi:hypothetical protein
VHPTFWFKLTISLVKPFLSNRFGSKIVFLDSMAELYTRIDPSQLRVSDRIIAFEQKEHGSLPLAPAAKSTTNSKTGEDL